MVDLMDIETLFRNGQRTYSQAGFRYRYIREEIGIQECLEFLIQVFNEQDPEYVARNIPLMVFSLRDDTEPLVKPSVIESPDATVIPDFMWINAPIRTGIIDSVAIREHLQQHRINLQVAENFILYQPDSVESFAKVIAICLSELIFKDVIEISNIQLFNYVPNFFFGWEGSGIDLGRVDFLPRRRYIARLKIQMTNQNYRAAFSKSIIETYQSATLESMKRLLGEIFINTFRVTRYCIVKKYLRFFSQFSRYLTPFNVFVFLEDNSPQELLEEVRFETKKLNFILRLFENNNIMHFSYQQALPMISNDFHTEIFNQLTIDNFPCCASFLIGIMRARSDIFDVTETFFFIYSITYSEFVELGRNNRYILEELERQDEIQHQINGDVDNHSNEEVNEEVNGQVNREVNEEVNREVNEEDDGQVNGEVNREVNEEDDGQVNDIDRIFPLSANFSNLAL